MCVLNKGQYQSSSRASTDNDSVELERELAADTGEGGNESGLRSRDDAPHVAKLLEASFTGTPAEQLNRAMYSSTRERASMRLGTCAFGVRRARAPED